MSAKLDEARSPLNDLFGLPALIPEDQQDSFKKFYTSLLKELAPETLIDRIEVRNYAIMLFEIARLKSLQAGLIEGSSLMSIQSLLPEALHHIAADYFLGDEEEKKEAEETLERLGIFETEIDAAAFSVQRDGAGKLESMIVYRENACRKLSRKFAKRASSNAKWRTNEIAEKQSSPSVVPTAKPMANAK